MKWIPRFAVMSSTLATLGVVAISAQTASLPIGKNGDVELTEPAALGSTVLQPGHYRFKHAMQDGQHYLVVSRQQTVMSGPGASRTNRHYGVGEGTEIARVPCQLVQLDAKVKEIELHTRKQPDGSRVITQIRIQGEGVGHLLALEPKA